MTSCLFAGQCRQRGFSRFEFAVAAAVFAILVGIGLDRLNFYQRQAESVAAEQLIIHLRTALQFKVAHLTAAQRTNELLTIADENPVSWLSEAPKNYLGEYYSPDHKKLTTGSWYFDRGDKMLVYLQSPPNSFAFHSSILLKFKVESTRLPLRTAQLAQESTIENLALVQVADQRSGGGQ